MEQHDYRERLARDAARWRIDGIITNEQERAILARSGAGSPGGVRALRLGWLITAVSVIGALVLGAGVILMFAANWEAMPDYARMASIIIGLVAVYAGAFVLMERLEMQRLGSALLLLGVVLFQASLFLVAQIYNMPVESPVIFLLGAMGAFPLAYLFGSRIVLLLALAAITTWRIWAASLDLDSGIEEWAMLIIAPAFGVLLYGIGRLHTTRTGVLSRLGEVYLFAGAVLVMAVVYCATFVEMWDELIYQDATSFAAPSTVYVAIGIAAAAVIAQLVVRAKTTLDMADIALQVGLLLLAAVVATWPAWTGYAIVFNGVFFAIAGAIIVQGYFASDERYINAGLIAIAVGLITRYFDTFWGLLGGATSFFGAGLVLLVVAFVLEQTRRRLLAEMNEPDDDDGAAAPQAALA